VALGVLLAFVLGYVGRMGEVIAQALAALQAADEAEEADEADEADEHDEGAEEYPRLRLTPERSAGKPVSRHAPCPCGSGKPYKRCCLGREA
jgi:uncharacterized protein YecA (UPF0149 family)